MAAPRRYVLALPHGVSREKLNNFINAWEERLLEEVPRGAPRAPIEATEVLYEALPAWYTEGEDWPIETSLRCWNCLMDSDGPPFFVPSEMRMVAPSGGNRLLRGDLRARSRVRSFRRDNVMCGINCAIAHIHHCMHGEQAFQCRERVMQLYHAMFRVRADIVEPAPRYTQLVQFGGDIPQAEYRERIAALEPHGLSCGARRQAILSPADRETCWIVDSQPRAAPPAPLPTEAQQPVVSMKPQPDIDLDELLGELDVSGAAAAGMAGANNNMATASSAKAVANGGGAAAANGGRLRSVVPAARAPPPVMPTSAAASAALPSTIPTATVPRAVAAPAAAAPARPAKKPASPKKSAPPPQFSVDDLLA